MGILTIKPNLEIKKRLLVLLIAFFVFVIGLIVRVGWIQLIRGDTYKQMAFEQQNKDREIASRRGTIYDRNGKELAISASAARIVVNPQEIKNSKKNIDTIAEALAGMLELKVEDVRKKLVKSSRYEVIKKKVEKEIGDKVRTWKNENEIVGVYIDEDVKRFYPDKNIAAHVIGFTGDDNQGLDGIERMAEQYLKGMNGKILSEVDAVGRQVPFNSEKRIDPKDGLNVVLTIDETIQRFATKALEKAITDNKLLNGATAVVLDPKTGDILALVSKPDFDPNNPKAAPPGVDSSIWKGNTVEDIKKLQETVWRNKAVTDTYEPGSTFKAITSSAGLEEGVITPESPVNDFAITVLGKNINCWKPNGHGDETFREGIYNSCNPVFVNVALRLGVQRFYNYMRAFGFYEKTGIFLPGEAGSIIHQKPSELDMAVASFGQRFQITPIQLISAYGAIANGGKLMKPRIIKELTDSEGNIVKKYEPEVVRNVISKKTSELLRNILEGVVSVGTGKNAYVPGYKVAGKTGTSETTETPKNGRYIASFSAIAPADDPVICALVVLDYPTGDSYYGGTIAAPVAGKLVEDILNYLGVERRYNEMDKKMIVEVVAVPDLKGKKIDEATQILKEHGFESKVEGIYNESSVIVDQMPKAGASLAKKSIVILYTEENREEAMVMVPNVKNKTVDEATSMLNNIGVNISINGRGNAITQSIEPGKMIPKGSVVEVSFASLEVD